MVDEWRKPTELEEQLIREAFEKGWKAHLNKGGRSFESHLASLLLDLEVHG